MSRISEFTHFTIWSGAIWWIAFHLIMQHLKLQLHGVGRHDLAHMKDKCGQYKWTLQQDGALSRTARISNQLAINAKMSLTHRADHNIVTMHQTTQNWIRWTICRLGSASEDDFPLQKFKVCARTKTYNSRCVATTVTSVPWTKYRRMAASPWKCSTV